MNRSLKFELKRGFYHAFNLKNNKIVLNYSKNTQFNDKIDKI